MQFGAQQPQNTGKAHYTEEISSHLCTEVSHSVTPMVYTLGTWRGVRQHWTHFAVMTTYWSDNLCTHYHTQRALVCWSLTLNGAHHKGSEFCMHATEFKHMNLLTKLKKFRSSIEGRFHNRAGCLLCCAWWYLCRALPRTCDVPIASCFWWGESPRTSAMWCMSR